VWSMVQAVGSLDVSHATPALGARQTSASAHPVTSLFTDDCTGSKQQRCL